jgi:hypothetical protein
MVQLSPLRRRMMVKTLRILRNSGFKELSKPTAGYLYRRTVRRLLPAIAEVKYYSIPISKERKFGDTILPGFIIPILLEDIADYEQTLLGALQAQVRLGDKVTIVGGGEGVTAVVAAKAVGETGSVICFEGSGFNVRNIKTTAARNKVSKRVAVKHAVVGEAISVYGQPEDHSMLVVRPRELPECDILEMDCEGAEIIILRNMTIRPRVIAVETHGVYGAPTKAVKELLEQLGYTVQECGLAEPRFLKECEEGDIRVLVGKRK